MIRIDSWMEASQMISKMILQVHDELVFDVWLPELESMTRLVREGMEWPVTFNGVERVFPIEIELGPSLGELEKQNGKSQV